LGAEHLHGRLARLVWQRTRGNPLFIDQVTGHLLDSGLVVVEGGTARLREAPDAAGPAIPDSIRGLITAQIDRLSPARQLTAKVSSAIGPLFPSRALTAFCPDRNVIPAVPEHIRALTQERLLRQERREPDPLYHFPAPDPPASLLRTLDPAAAAAAPPTAPRSGTSRSGPAAVRSSGSSATTGAGRAWATGRRGFSRGPQRRRSRRS
jgi:hypothetical protein